ncbi:MAG TPA: sulfatase-like hydrolase/transferase, partial [bacterium]|nr:sulfatase-like hydrolase/transferase [bacterium]
PEPAKSAIGEITRYSKDIQRRIVLHYFASISLIDDCIGRLIDLLKGTGQFDDTLIVFTSDHGEFLGNHTLLRKPSIHFDEVLKVPLLMKLPGRFSKKKVFDGLMELVDVCPTILGFLQIPANPGLQGIDWSTSILDGSFSGRTSIYCEMYHIRPLFGTLAGPYTSVMTIRTLEWKLNIYPEAGIQYGQLFNLKEDASESKNLYSHPQYRTIKEEMLWELSRRRFLMADPLPLWLTQY